MLLFKLGLSDLRTFQYINLAIAYYHDLTSTFKQGIYIYIKKMDVTNAYDHQSNLYFTILQKIADLV